MNNRRVLALVAAVLLATFCLAPCLEAADADGVMMHEGKVMMMEKGKPAGPMQSAMTMSDGTTVTTDGTIKMKDGTQTHMKDGQMMMMDGHLMEGGHSGMMGGGSTGGMNP